jgi:hypothetical protein
MPHERRLCYLLAFLTVVSPIPHELAALLDDVASLVGARERIALDM